MGFEASSFSLSRFVVLDSVSQHLITEIPQRLKKHACRDIDDVPEVRSFGWTAFNDLLNVEFTEVSPFLGQYALFSLRLDTRRIPPAVIKKHVALALQKERLEAGRAFISRERKKEIREQTLLRLLQRFLPIPALFDVIWLLEKNEVWFASTQGKMIDLFMELFLATFDLRLSQLAPFDLAQRLLNEADRARLELIEATTFA